MAQFVLTGCCVVTGNSKTGGIIRLYKRGSLAIPFSLMSTVASNASPRARTTSDTDMTESETEMTETETELTETETEIFWEKFTHMVKFGGVGGYQVSGQEVRRHDLL